MALARALATEPDLLLLDEPLAALDVDVAAAIRQTLRRVLAGRTAILVTHEILDAVLLADRIAVLDAGRVVENGTTHTVTRQPRSAFAASIGGLNMLAGTATGPRSPANRFRALVVHGQPDSPLTCGERAIAVFRPSAVSVHRTPPTGSPRNLFTGAVTALEPQAHLIRVRIDDLSADITPASVAELDLATGRLGALRRQGGGGLDLPRVIRFHDPAAADSLLAPTRPTGGGAAQLRCISRPSAAR